MEVECTAPDQIDQPLVKKAKVTQIAKPDSHHRTYSFLELENGVRVVVASDPTCDKAGAAACMNVGMCHERKDLPGLAHFLEHMLFTGTKTYPSEREYHEFISQHGGSANAVTGCYFTTYMFDVKPEKLTEVLDRFARCFSEPTLSRDCTEREMNAVDSEFKMGFTEPWWRFVGIMNMSANPAHPFHVAVGNNKVLLEDPKANGIDLYTEMRRLYDETYSANGLTVCIIGRESTVELEALAKEKFGCVVNKGVTMPIGDDHGCGQPPFLPQEWHRLLLQNPVKDVKEFHLTWVIPYQAPLWRTKPSFYVSHLLGYEGKGSVIAALKDLGLITQCYTSDGEWLQGSFSLFRLQCDLTDKGLSELKAIGKYFFAYIQMLQRVPVQKWIWEELSNLQHVQFKQGEDAPPFDLAAQIADSLQIHPPSEVLAGDQLLYEYDPDGIKRIIDLLQLSTVRVSYQSKSLADKCTDKDTSYDSPMKFESIPEDWLKEWGADLDAESLGLTLPEKNPFIPEDLSLKAAEKQPAAFPKRLGDEFVPSHIACILHRQDHTFLQPKVAACISIWSPYMMETAETMLKTSMWCSCVQEELNAYAYDAEVAGLNYQLGVSAGRINLSISGFNDKLGILLKTVVQKMRSLVTVSENVYGIVADEFEDDLSNALFHSEPCAQIGYRFADLLQRGGSYPLEAQYSALQQVNREDFDGFPSKLFEAGHVEMFVLGNAAPADAKELGDILTKELRLPKTLPILPDRKEGIFLPGSTIWKVPSKDQDDPNNAIKLWMQFESSDENKVMLLVLNSVIGTKFFDVLRTQQQLGYIVGMGSSFTASFCYLTALVQTEFSIDYVRSRIDSVFAEHFMWVQTDLGEDEFVRCCEGILADLKTKPKNLSEEMAHWSRGFSERTYDFKFRERLIDLLEKKMVTLEKFKSFVTEKIGAAAKLYIEVVKAEPTQHITYGSKVTTEMLNPDTIVQALIGQVTDSNEEQKNEEDEDDNEVDDDSEDGKDASIDVTALVVQRLRSNGYFVFDEELGQGKNLTIFTETESCKTLPPGTVIPRDPPETRKWVGEQDGIAAFDAATSGWVSWKGCAPDAWKLADS